MLHIDDQVITLAILILSIIICFRTSSTMLCTIIGSILVSIIYKNNKKEYNIALPSLMGYIYPSLNKKVSNSGTIKVSESKKKPKDNFSTDNCDNNIIKIEPDFDYINYNNKFKDYISENIRQQNNVLQHIAMQQTLLQQTIKSKKPEPEQIKEFEQNTKSKLKQIDISEPKSELESIDNKQKNKDNSVQEYKVDGYISRSDIPSNCNSDDVIDGDERIAYSSIYRNEPTRVIMGMGKAYQNLSRYVLEEVEEIEGKEWWGNNDF